MTDRSSTILFQKIFFTFLFNFEFQEENNLFCHYLMKKKWVKSSYNQFLQSEPRSDIIA